MSIVGEIPGYLQVLSDGSVKRFTPEAALTFPTSPDTFKFKDVTIDTTKPITARIFIPTAESATRKLPLLVYFHGGGFCIGSTTWSGYHYFLGDLSARVQCVVVSVDYRLAPESRLPIAYEDGYAALEWITLNKGTDPWLGQTDLSRVIVSGDSAGGNIAHHVAIRATLNKIHGMEIRGLMPIHPYFGSEKRTQKELETVGPVLSNDLFWGLSIPVGSDRDYFGCNFENAVMSVEEWRRFPSHVVVFVAGLDFLKERGEMYFEFLKRKGVEDVRLVEAEGEQHVYHVFEPGSEGARLLQRQMGEVIRRV